MQVREAKDIAKAWVTERLGDMPYCMGVVLHGSINWLADSDELPTASDVDLPDRPLHQQIIALRPFGDMSRTCEKSSGPPNSG